MGEGGIINKQTSNSSKNWNLASPSFLSLPPPYTIRFSLLEQNAEKNRMRCMLPLAISAPTFPSPLQNLT